MKVSIEPHIAHLSSGKEVRFNQYRIRVDGQHVGFVGFAENAKILLSVRFGPVELEEIKGEVSRLVKSEREIKQAAQPPEGFHDANNEELDDLDDLDS